MADIVCETF